jgi:ABC-2 type transport system ATP-binding protein
MPESPGLYLRLSVTENLSCFADLYEVADPKARIEQVLRAVNLADRAADPCGALSRVCADLRRRGVTIFLTTHRLEEAERLCDRVAILNTTFAHDRAPGRTAGSAVQQDAHRAHRRAVA